MTIPVRVLIVDGSEADAFLATRALRRGGYQVNACRVDTPEMLDLALRQHWDIVLCDSVTARLDVIRALQLIHGTAPRIPVVVFSGRRMEELHEVLAATEVRAVIEKERVADLPLLLRGLLPLGRFTAPHQPATPAVAPARALPRRRAAAHR